MFGIVQTSLTLLSLNHNFQDLSLVIYKSKLTSLSLSMSCVLKFITFTLEVKRSLWSASHSQTVLQRSYFVVAFDSGEKKFIFGA